MGFTHPLAFRAPVQDAPASEPYKKTRGIHVRLTMLAFAVAALAAGNASAGTAGGSFKVTAKVSNSCVVTSTQDVAFGAYDPANANNTTARDGAGYVTVRCTRGTDAAIALDQGANAAAGSLCATPLRQMGDGNGNTLRYNLYSDSNRSVTWGCDGSNDVEWSFTNLSPKQFDAYGRIPAGQDVPAGDYEDTVNVTVTF